ncbi:MAG TPA: RNA polymerase sigma factor [Kofleriaceae bacterium]|nr:RNA polymerase sigma factor [Kofleriaceae bacterium]
MDELFRLHGDFLRRLARHLCRAAFDPDDLLQDVLERTVQHVDALAPHGDHRAWMARVMRNLFIDRLRRRAAAPAQDALPEDAPAPPPESRAWWEGLDADDIRARMAGLPDEMRAAFELFVFEGCSYAEIARRLDIPKMTVGTRILRARRKLKQLFVASRGTEASEGPAMMSRARPIGTGLSAPGYSDASWATSSIGRPG